MRRYYNTPYYIVPREAVGQETFAVIRDAMAAKGLVGLGRVVLSNRERPILIEPMGSGLRGITLRYAHEVRDEAEYFADIPKMTLPDEMLRITEHILETKTEDFDPAYLEDRYRTVLVEKLRAKQAQNPARSTASAPSRAERHQPDGRAKAQPGGGAPAFAGYETGGTDRQADPGYHQADAATFGGGFETKLRQALTRTGAQSRLAVARRLTTAPPRAPATKPALRRGRHRVG